MHKCLVFIWTMIIGVQMTIAQVKDTLRGNIDYRRNTSFPDKNQSQYRSVRNSEVNASNTFRDQKKLRKDTVRSEIDYSRNYRFHRSYKYKEIPFTHYLGLQGNSIFQEIFQPDSSYMRNPFVFTYSLNHKSRGYGLGFGYGYTEWGGETMNFANNVVATLNSRRNFRLSLDKKSVLGKRFLIGAGADMVFSQSKAIQKTFINGLVDGVYSKTSGWGFGPRVSILLKVNRWIYVGTETSLYLKRSTTKSNTKFTGLPPENVKENSNTSLSYLAPLSVFVTLKIN